MRKVLVRSGNKCRASTDREESTANHHPAWAAITVCVFKLKLKLFVRYQRPSNTAGVARVVPGRFGQIAHSDHPSIQHLISMADFRHAGNGGKNLRRFHMEEIAGAISIDYPILKTQTELADMVGVAQPAR